jgi:hypothetical protein
MPQSFSPWILDPKITEPFGDISVASLGTTILLLSTRDGFLRVTFRQIHAMAIHEEFAHPLVDDDDASLPSLPNGQGSYPHLVVSDSDWIKSFSEIRLQGDGRSPVHYQFISMSYFVDVLSYIPPAAEWVASEAFDAMFGGIAA